MGANALSKGLEGNKSLRVHKLPHVPFYVFIISSRVKFVLSHWPFYLQELHLHGNSIGDEGIRALMAGLSSHKGFFFFLFEQFR